MKIIMFLSIYGLSVLPLSYPDSIVFSRLEPRHTIHVYGPPLPPNMTMETFGLAMNALCVSLCVCAFLFASSSCLLLETNLLFSAKFLPAEMCLLSVHKACNNDPRAEPVLSQLCSMKTKVRVSERDRFAFFS